MNRRETIVSRLNRQVRERDAHIARLEEQLQSAERTRLLLVQENDQMGASLDDLHEQLETLRDAAQALNGAMAQWHRDNAMPYDFIDYHLALTATLRDLDT